VGAEFPDPAGAEEMGPLELRCAVIAAWEQQNGPAHWERRGAMVNGTRQVGVRAIRQ